MKKPGDVSMENEMLVAEILLNRRLDAKGHLIAWNFKKIRLAAFQAGLKSPNTVSNSLKKLCGDTLARKRRVGKEMIYEPFNLLWSHCLTAEDLWPRSIDE